MILKDNVIKIEFDETGKLIGSPYRGELLRYNNYIDVIECHFKFLPINDDSVPGKVKAKLYCKLPDTRGTTVSYPRGTIDGIPQTFAQLSFDEESKCYIARFKLTTIVSKFKGDINLSVTLFEDTGVTYTNEDESEVGIEAIDNYHAGYITCKESNFNENVDEEDDQDILYLIYDLVSLLNTKGNGDQVLFDDGTYKELIPFIQKVIDSNKANNITDLDKLATILLSKNVVEDELSNATASTSNDDSKLSTIQQAKSIAKAEVENVKAQSVNDNDSKLVSIEQAKSITDNAIANATASSKTDEETKLVTLELVKQLINELVDDSPEALNTLKEISKALNNDSDFANTITKALSQKLNILDAANNYAAISNLRTVNGQPIYAEGGGNIVIDIGDDLEMKTTVINCNHLVEITGNTSDDHKLAIEDQHMLITKIQGQSQSRSPNLFNQSVSLISAGLVAQNDGSYYSSNAQNASGKTIWINTTNATRVKLVVDVYYPGTIQGIAINFRYSDGTSESVVPTDIFGSWFEYSVSSNSSKTIVSIGFSWVSVNGTYFKNFAIYSDMTINHYIPYDDDFACSNASFISTKTNYIKANDSAWGSSTIIDGDGNVTENSDFNTYNDYIPVYPGQTYIYSQDVSVGAVQFAQYDKYKNFISLTSSTQFGVAITIPNDCYYLKIVVWNSGGSDIPEKYWLNLGSSVLPYEGYDADGFEFGIPLKQYDSFNLKNGELIEQTSDVYIFDGSENWFSENNYFRLDYTLPDRSGTNTNILTNRLKLVAYSSMNTSGNYWNATIYTTSIRVNKSGYSTVAEFKEALAQFPIKLIYKTTSYKVTKHKETFPSGYTVYKNGLQIQAVKGRSLPYNLTKEYALSVKAQIALNMEVDRHQQNLIEELKVYKKQKKATTTSSNTATTITGSDGLSISVYSFSGTTTLLKGLDESKIECSFSGSISGVSYSYNNSTGVLTFSGKSLKGGTTITAFINYSFDLATFVDNYVI